MSITIPDKKVIGIEFPGIVNNVSKAVEMLGGLSRVYNAFDNEKERLVLSFRPDMVYSKPTCGDRNVTNGFLLRVQRLRNKKTGEIKLETTVLGYVNAMYKFEAMADFQYGPFERISSKNLKEPPKYNIFYHDLLIKEPTTIIDPYLSRETPLYLPPIQFSRRDRPLAYNFVSRYRSTEYIELEEKSQNVPITRKTRTSFVNILKYGDEIPTEPCPLALENLNQYGKLGTDILNTLRKLFAERPVWFRSALFYRIPPNTQISIFKLALSSVAYYFIRGPWARAWIRMGYDPSLLKEARYFQVIDFRVQSYAVIKKLLRHVTLRRKLVHNVKPSMMKQKDKSCKASTSGMTCDDSDQEEFGEVDDEVDMENQSILSTTTTGGTAANDKQIDFQFGPNNWPTAHQVRYCLMDIDVPEIKSLLEAEPTVDKCDVVEGWFEPGTMKMIRDYLAQYLNKWMTETKKTDISMD